MAIGDLPSLERKPPEVSGFGDKAPSVGRFLQFFNKNNAFLYIFLPK